MDNQFEKPKEKTVVEELREKIINSPTAVEAEFERTDNIWLDCFTTRIFVIETYLEVSKNRELLSSQQYQEARRKLEELKEFHRNLLSQYPNKDTIPPDEIKRELFKRLDILN